MHTNEYLFPVRQTRRDFLKLTGAATAGVAAGLSLPGCKTAEPAKPGVRIGSGYHTYEVVEGWGQLPAGMKYGFGCGIVVDGQDRVYVTSRSTNPAVAVFDRKGTLLETWGSDVAGLFGLSPAQVKDTAHCLYWSKEPAGEFFYWTDDGSLANLRYDRWKIVFMEQRAHGLEVWQEPLVTLRFPKLFFLRTDPYERSDHEAGVDV